ncbi:helix-turn-helix domain-containing protein [Aquimarina aquimarini]|uniref:helix-turn-helix domain-containing protein n=1 Tax=Aquimarina aquimarini TaxID=1191734 RepID=UPI000D55DC3F|nr:helix-turn-helix domain-containing protein [Aquimarina aquimarini]
MGLKLYLKDVEDIMSEFGENQYDVDSVGVEEFSVSYCYNSIKGWFKEISLDSFKISYGNNQLFDKTTIFFEYDQETVEMHFTLQGESFTSINALPYDYSVNSNMHNIFYCNDIKGKVDWNSKNMHFFEINLSPDFFKKYLPDDHLFCKFKKIIENKRIGFLNQSCYPITPQMYFVINEIINCPWKNGYRKMFLEAKVLELLLFQMDQIREYDLKSTTGKISKTVIEKMHHAKDIILSKLGCPMSLSDLAREINTNECTLKKEFKSVFGTTVFGYIRDVKMEEAKNILISQKLSVNEVSDIVGYKNPQHFSTAFKRKFGINPSGLIKK